MGTFSLLSGLGTCKVESRPGPWLERYKKSDLDKYGLKLGISLAADDDGHPP